MSPSATTLVGDEAGVAELAAAIRRVGTFAMDLEFVSEDRYVPELALVQVAWGDPAAPEVAAIDPLAVEPRALFDLVADPAVDMVAHAARQDLGLLTTTYGVTARGFGPNSAASTCCPARAARSIGSAPTGSRTSRQSTPISIGPARDSA